MKKIFLIFLSFLTLTSCAMHSSLVSSELQQAKRHFDQGYYRHALCELLPLACDGIPEAQYAVGYMYYYGFGATQDTDVGVFWIERAASHHYRPAEEALAEIMRNKHQM